MPTTDTAVTLATRRNMDAVQAAQPTGNVRAYDPTTGELAHVSLSTGDYFALGMDEPLMSADGCEPLPVSCSVSLTRTKAEAFLRDRFEEQAHRYPLLRSVCTADQYVAANLRAAMKLSANRPIEGGERSPCGASTS